MEKTFNTPKISFFKAPITNTTPYKEITIEQVHRYIKAEFAKARTEALRAITDPRQARIYKAARFDYATFCGVFSSRSDKALIKESGLLCIDFDHLPNLEALFQKLLQDRYFETALLFRSPSGDGLKWIIETDRGSYTPSDYYQAISNYITQAYGVTPDKSGKDLSRACFLPHDPEAYLNSKYAINDD